MPVMADLNTPVMAEHDSLADVIANAVSYKHWPSSNDTNDGRDD